MYHPLTLLRLPVLGAVVILVLVAAAPADDSFQPDESTLPVKPPKGAIVLLDEHTCKFVDMFGGKIDWPVENGVITSSRRTGRGNGNHIVSTVHFRDADMHVEFMIPENGPGNSGVYIHGNYEMQVFSTKDGDEVTQDDVGAIYGFHKPLVNAGRPRGVWQVYDIRYTAPRRDESGKIVSEGSITAWLNGKKVQDDAKFGEPRSVFHPFRFQTTDYLRKIYAVQKKTGVGPVFLQDHGNPVKFRNMWIVPRDELAHPYTAE